MSAFSLISAPLSLTVQLRSTDYALLPPRITGSVASVYDLIANHFRRDITR